jgi:predicted Zn-ribbon and HTH transcriptional regulator
MIEEISAKDRKAELMAIALETGEALARAQYADARIPSRTWSRFHTAVTALAVASDSPVADVVDDVTAMINTLLGLPPEYGRWNRLGLGPPTTLERINTLDKLGLRTASEPPLTTKAKAREKAQERAEAKRNEGPTIEHFTCRTCSTAFSRERTRGRKPSQCPDCRTNGNEE